MDRSNASQASRGAHVAIVDDVAPDTTSIAGMLLQTLLLVFAFSGFNITHFLGSPSFPFK